MGWIGIAGGNAMGRGSKSPYTPDQYNDVLRFFQQNAGNFYTVNEVDEGARIGSEVTTKAIIDAQVANRETGVRRDPKSGKYGILSPYTPKQYNAVLAFFQENAGIFYSVSEITEESGIVLTLAQTQAIVDAQVADPTTGVQQDPKSGKYGIPKKGKK